ncbi:hypothetical protein FRC06_011823, partial [Ceratobasidium sp. 370]
MTERDRREAERIMAAVRQGKPIPERPPPPPKREGLRGVQLTFDQDGRPSVVVPPTDEVAVSPEDSATPEGSDTSKNQKGATKKASTDAKKANANPTAKKGANTKVGGKTDRRPDATEHTNKSGSAKGKDKVFPVPRLAGQE